MRVPFFANADDILPRGIELALSRSVVGHTLLPLYRGGRGRRVCHAFGIRSAVFG